MKILAATTLILWMLAAATAVYSDFYRPFDRRLDDWLRRLTLAAVISTVVLCGWVLV